jgi:hypothetical protein
VGVAGLLIGGIFGIDAMGKKSDAGCSSDSVCPSTDAANKLRDAKSAGNLSTAFFIAGGVVAAAGFTIWAVAPRRGGATASAAVDAQGLVLHGVW